MQIGLNTVHVLLLLLISHDRQLFRISEYHLLKLHFKLLQVVFILKIIKLILTYCHYRSAMIAITEPRRVAAISMSQRVAMEMNLSSR